MRDCELHRELRDRAAVVRTALAWRIGRLAPLVETDREGTETTNGVGLGVDRVAEVGGRLEDGVFEQCQEELVLAVEVLVEATQRLLRAVDDLLDREVGAALLVDEL